MAFFELFLRGQFILGVIHTKPTILSSTVDRNSQVKRNGYERNVEGGERNAHPTK